MNFTKSIQLLAVLTCIFILPLQSFARGHSGNNNVEFEVFSDQRGHLNKFSLPTNSSMVSKHAIIAKNGESYRIRVANKSNKRIGVVIAVDGINIISGKHSHLKSHEQMYVLNPYQIEDFYGWSDGYGRNNRFQFTDLHNVNSKGRIALAVFNERSHKVKQYNSNNSSHRRGYGKSNGRHRGNYFTAQDRPSSKKIIRYERRSDLCQQGIVQCGPKHRKNNFRKDRGYVSFPGINFNLRF